MKFFTKLEWITMVLTGVLVANTLVPDYLVDGWRLLTVLAAVACVVPMVIIIMLIVKYRGWW
jgi:hypothetical protein